MPRARRRDFAAGSTRSPIADPPRGYRLVEQSVHLRPIDEAELRRVATTWELKRRAGFRVPPTPPRAGQDVVITAGFAGVRFTEPAHVVWADADGFGYETRPGHPLHGEESFLVRSHPDGGLVFTLRSLSRSGGGLWALALPAVRVIQHRVVRRYLRVAIDASR
ncbi:DUF1990 family protein [Microbacterium ulmi]|uniref:DUF1990 domain-containing protein n=1 Tax=Microbacterium ulmi TaxID=179095 RepID=A0A7Y2PXL4_9MICO|nr:DUF1990 family protein [Microbacterium ulmi]NII71089.1 uncharacterized protein (UPF0548 family) [Microbacterium ulmi]NNH02396.1 DUF1990 domain-containing protein [Microbacterium ulmi]